MTTLAPTLEQIESTHGFYLDICRMVTNGLPIKTAHRLLSDVVCFNNGWRVVGITEKALCMFHAQDYESFTKQGIQRCHLFNRQQRNVVMLANPITNAALWYTEWMDKDKAVLGSSSENKALESSTPPLIHWFDHKESLTPLFRTSGYKWKHGEDERLCLAALYSLTR